MFIDRVAFQIGNLTIYWYGVFVALGFLAGYMVMSWKGGKVGVSGHTVADLTFNAMIGGILGARVFYVLTHLREFEGNWLEIIRIDHGGLVFYGGFFGAAAAVLWYVKRKQLDVWIVADLFAVAVPIGQALGRIGCFINGCCFGKPDNSWLAVTYPPQSSVWFAQLHQNLVDVYSTQCLSVFPSQLLQSSVNFLNWSILMALSTRLRKGGQVFAWYLILYALGRFATEFFRGDYSHHYWGLSISQLICIGLLALGVTILKKRSAIVITDKTAEVPNTATN